MRAPGLARSFLAAARLGILLGGGAGHVAAGFGGAGTAGSRQVRAGRDCEDALSPRRILTSKGIPEELLERLRRSAEVNRRSLNAEVIHRLERAVADPLADPETFLARVRESRARMNIWVTDEDVRAARDEGRP